MLLNDDEELLSSHGSVRIPRHPSHYFFLSAGWWLGFCFGRAAAVLEIEALIGQCRHDVAMALTGFCSVLCCVLSMRRVAASPWARLAVS